MSEGNGIDLGKPTLPKDSNKPTKERWDDQKMRDQIGITVDVEREKQANDSVTRANHALCDVGDYIHSNTPSVAQLQYLGSAAVHIYLAPHLDQVVYVTQTGPLRDTPERVAGPAFTQLQRDMMGYYNRKTTKLRSGF